MEVQRAIPKLELGKRDRPNELTGEGVGLVGREAPAHASTSSNASRENDEKIPGRLSHFGSLARMNTP